MGDSLSNSIHDKGLSHKHCFKVANKPGAACEIILPQIDDVIKSKPEYLVHL